MRLMIFFSIFFSLSAGAGMPQHWVTWPLNGTLYLDQSLCPGKCYPIVSGGAALDLDVVKLDVASGTLVVDQVKADAKAKALADAKAAADQIANDQKARQDAYAALLDATPGTLTNVQRDRILIDYAKWRAGK